jgi:Winged helix domain
MAKLTVAARVMPDGRTFTVTGRDAWALLELAKAGPWGCTPIDNPGPRWSGYVFKLKRHHGLDIETMHEGHEGQFPGTHARYVLRSAVEVVSRSDDLEATAA